MAAAILFIDSAFLLSLRMHLTGCSSRVGKMMFPILHRQEDFINLLVVSHFPIPLLVRRKIQHILSELCRYKVHAPGRKCTRALVPAGKVSAGYRRHRDSVHVAYQRFAVTVSATAPFEVLGLCPA